MMIKRRYDWSEISSLSGDALKHTVFSILRDAAVAVQSDDLDDPNLLEVIPRLAELVETRNELISFKEAFSALARATGLWNYIDKDNADIFDVLLAETVSAPELDGVTLHREQIAALNILFEGKNLILSAPTSFGKSLLIDALLASGRYSRVAIILPTIALLDEFKRRLRRRFENKFRIIMHANEEAPEGPTIFLGTQERLINRTDLGALDMTVVDEFYKLDPRRRDERNVILNAAVYNLLRRSRQFFFLGPNIDGVQVAPEGRWQFEFLRTRFSTVAVDTYDLRGVRDKRERLFEEVAEEKNWPALVFVSSPDKANRLAEEAAEEMAISDDSKDFYHWLRDNVGERWPLLKGVANGFALHHGRIPRAIASQMIRMFNRMELPVLFCTSTMIEGVNTAAKTVLIFDKTISRSNYDFFTFSNIKGRAGRLGQHHVGRVYLFNEPPEHEIMEVSPTLFGEDEEAPDDYVVHLDEEETEAGYLDDRIAFLRKSLQLDRDGLRVAASIGLEDAVALRQLVTASLRQGDALLWAGWPTYQDIKNVVGLICKVRKPSHFGAFSADQLSYWAANLRQSETMRDFFLDHDRRFKGDLKSYDNIFKFLRACEYGLPQFFAVVQLFVKANGREADYSLFVRDLSRWFRPEDLKNLDEEGIPIQISERFYQEGDDRSSLVAKLEKAVLKRSPGLSAFERRWVAAALDLHPDQTGAQ